MTGSLLDRYKQQGADCDVGFLFEAISLLTALDGSLRTSSNQRLSVELGLMKLCGLGQKKNDSTGQIASPALPPLQSNRTATVSSVEIVSTQPPVEQKPSSPPQRNESTPTITPTSPSQEKPATPAETASKPKPPAPHTIRSISGLPISSIMNASRGSYTGEPTAEEKHSSQETEKTDPDSENKIRNAMPELVRRIEKVRPRIAMAFRELQTQGNILKINVPNESLREDILRNQSEILSLLIDVAHLEGTAKLEVTVVEKVTGLKPVRVEDRLKFLTEKNPLLTALRKEMDLDVE